MRTIEIVTAQNVRIDYPLAEFRQRMVAAILDMIIVVVLLIGMALLLNNLRLFQYDTFGVLMQVLSFGGMYVLYQIACDVFLQGRTIGKLAQGLQVARLDGKSMTLSDSFIRAVLSLAETYYCGGVIASLLVASSEKRQRLGDMAAGTTVISLGEAKNYNLESLSKIANEHSHTPQFPQIRQFSEEDMLKIQSALAQIHRYPNDAHDRVLTALVNHICKTLDIPTVERKDRVVFLRTLIKDYIALTR